MSRVLAFDFGASTGRAILAEYKNGKLSYNEVHRFDNNLVEKDGLLCWDFDYLLNEVKKAIDMCENVDSLAFDTWELTTVCSIKTESLYLCPFATVTTERKTRFLKYLKKCLIKSSIR